MAPHAEFSTTNTHNYGHNGWENSHANPVNHANSASLQKPNILYVIADQMSAPVLPFYDPESPIKTPHLDKLAKNGVLFENAYTNSPLCAPSRFTMVTGQLPSKIGAFDNASPLSPDIPTFAHYLRREGYETVLAGKMHFVGKEQHYGFEQRLTSDIYPADFGWSVNWDEPDKRQEWFHNMSSVLQAGPASRTNQLDYDEEVIYKSTQYLYDHVRKGGKRRPFFLTVSMTHPHDPYAISREYWDRYEDVDIPLPKTQLDQKDQDAHSQRLLKCVDLWDHPMPEEAIKRARRAYYGACSYVDDQIGKLLSVLRDCYLDQNTIVVFSSDHGDMLGERSLWYKMSFFENSARVPLLVHYPSQFAPRRVKENVSTMDLLPTFVDLVGGSVSRQLPLDGRSFYPALVGEAIPSEVIGEYTGEGTISPLVMIKRDNLKFIYCLTDEPQVYDLLVDPLELTNLAASEKEEHKRILADFLAEAKERWGDFKTFTDDVLKSQRQRRLVWSALRQGLFESWDFQPKDDTSQKYIRSNIPLDDLELRARFPPVDAFGRPLTVGSSL